jgi:bifunctional UDP-N-acetylglucosamine pyrophosphorylase/glucosamine-1-phosphate N-acetyltransferase
MVQAVIMAAGKSTRTYPLTLTRPKPLLKIANKPILEHQLEQLVGLVEEVILVVGYRKEMIQAYFRSSYRGLPLRYVTQEEQLGTGHAAMQVRSLIQDRFVLLNGDDLYHREDIQGCLQYPYAILAQEVKDARDYGVLIIEHGLVKDMLEKSPDPPTRFANTGLYVLDRAIFDILEGIERSPRGEYEITSAMKILAQRVSIVCRFVQKYWIPIAYPWSLLQANELLMKEARKDYTKYGKGKLWGGPGIHMGEGVEINGMAWVGSDCVIESECRLKGFVTLGDGCFLGSGTMVENSLIGDRTQIGSRCQISNSVLGEEVQIGSGFRTLYELPGNPTIRARVKNSWVDTGLTKLGVILGDRVRLGQNVITHPGVYVDPEVEVPTGSVLKSIFA